MLQTRAWSPRETGDLPEITELLRGDGRTPATQSRSPVSTLGVTLVFPDGRLGWPENWGLVLLTGVLSRTGGSLKGALQPLVICVMFNGN